MAEQSQFGGGFVAGGGIRGARSGERIGFGGTKPIRVRGVCCLVTSMDLESCDAIPIKRPDSATEFGLSQV